MMASPNQRVHIERVADLRKWLVDNAYSVRDGKGDYQVMQVLISGRGWQVVYSRGDVAEDLRTYTINKHLLPVVEKYLLEKISGH